MATYGGKTLEEKAIEIVTRQMEYEAARANMHDAKSISRYAEGNPTGGRLRRAMAERYRIRAMTLAGHIDAIRTGKPDAAARALRSIRTGELEHMIHDDERIIANSADSVVRELASANTERLKAELRRLPNMDAEELMEECFGQITDEELTAVWSA